MVSIFRNTNNQGYTQDNARTPSTPVVHTPRNTSSTQQAHTQGMSVDNTRRTNQPQSANTGNAQTRATVAPQLPKLRKPTAAQPTPVVAQSDDDFVSSLASGVVLSDADEPLDLEGEEWVQNLPLSKNVVPKMSTPKAKKWRMTENDYRALRYLDRVGWATATHLAIAAGTTPNWFRHRIKKLVKAGYLREWTTYGVLPVFTLSHNGLGVIGSDGRVRGKKSPTTLAHTLKISTLVALMNWNDEFRVELSKRWHHERLVIHNRHERNREARYQANLAKCQSLNLSEKAEEEWTPQERRLVRALNHGYIPKEEPPFLPFNFFPDNPALASVRPISIHEDAIESGAAAIGDRLAQLAAFQRLDTQKELADLKDKFDSMEADFRQSVFDSEGREWMYQSYELDQAAMPRFHRPDAVMVLPPVAHPDGRLQPLSIWLEVEDHTKPTLDDTITTMVHAIKHPLVNQCWYFTLEKQVATHIQKAKAELIKRISDSYGGYMGIPEMSKEAAEELVHRVIKVKKSPYFNEAVMPGFWG